jgi:hypothetical protein
MWEKIAVSPALVVCSALLVQRRRRSPDGCGKGHDKSPFMQWPLQAFFYFLI